MRVLAETPTLTWLDLEDPQSPALEELAARYGFHELAVEDCRNEQQLAKIGLRLELRVLTYATYLAVTRRRAKSALSPQGWTQDFPDPGDFFEPLFSNSAINDTDSNNTSFYRNPALDELLDRARREQDAPRRKVLYREANRIVWQNRPVAIRFASRDDAARLPLRKEPRREGTLRLIEVEDWDLSACGGTHVSRTGEIGVIAIAGWERFKGGQRVEFLCGGRAVQRFGAMRDTLASGVRLLSVLPEELPASIERLQAELKDHKRAATALHGELAQYRAAELAAASESGAHGRLVARVVDADANGLKTLATAVCAAGGFVVVLVSAASPSLVVVARSSNVTLAAQQLVAALVAQFGGRGGGRPELAQAGGLVGPPDAIVARAKELVL